MASDKDQKDNEAVIDDFGDLVNMTPKSIEDWLKTDESKAVGQKKDGDKESTGHHMGREIVQILHKKKSDYDDEDVAHMRKVTGYIKRHLAQKPDGDIEDNPWRRSLMNWGHDPLKK